jgi:trk system potassium uptake protein TrkA
MAIMIVGGGRLGSFLADLLMDEKKERIIIVEKDESKVERLQRDLKCSIISGDGCNPDVLRKAGVLEVKTVVAATGDDEDNIIICQLAKFEFRVPRVIARVSSPKNEWLYTKDMGVDAAVSSARSIARLLEEEVELSNIFTLFDFAAGKISLIKSAVKGSSKAAHKQIKNLGLPEDCVVMAVIRNNNVLLPSKIDSLEPGDEVLSVVEGECKEKFDEIFNAK